jgi:hypothetical protein
MHPQSETELKAPAEDFLNEYHQQTVDDVHKLFMDEAMMRYSQDDDGNNRESYWNRAYEIFSEVVRQQYERALELT